MVMSISEAKLKDNIIEALSIFPAGRPPDEEEGVLSVPGRKKGYLSASFTVEASFVIPLIVLGIIALIGLVIYLRNSVKTMADADMMIFAMEREQALDPVGSDEKRYSYEAEIGDYYSFGINKAAVERDGRKISSEILINQDDKKKGLLGRFLSGMSTIDRKSEKTMIDRSETVRIIKAASELVGDLKKMIKGDSP